ncbi:MAG: hypothetical protein WAM97_23005 [Acidimicrobiales bacterium]
MHPWLTKQLMDTRVAERHRNAERASLGRAEPLPAAHSQASPAASSRLRRGLGRVLVRIGSRAGGFESPQTAHIL